MTASTLITDYVGRGVAASRPATPNVPTGATAVYYATDTDILSIWDGSAWDTINVGGLASIADDRVLANISGGAAAPTANTLTAIIDACIGGANGDFLIRVGGVWTVNRPKYVLGFSSPQTTVYSNSQVIGHHRVAAAVTIPANFGAHLGLSSKAGGTAVTTASTVFNVDKAATATPNTFVNAGTITFAIGTVTPTFASSGGTAITFSAGDVLRIVAPASADATFAGFYCTLVGYET